MKKIWKRIKNRARRNEISITASIIWGFKIRAGSIKFHFYDRIKIIKEWLSKRSFFFKVLFCWVLFSLVVLAIILIVWPEAINFYIFLRKQKNFDDFYFRIVDYLILLVSAIVSFLSVSMGLWVAIWGRIIQHKSHLHERYEKAAVMLGDEVMAVRIAGCRALMSLGKEDKSMKIQCVRLLFAFINNPYLKETEQYKDPNDLFSDENKPLRADIQESANSFSAIYNHYGDKGIDNEKVELPSYFWKSRKKGRTSLIKAYFILSELEKAYLFRANLRGANLWGANLQEAYLGRASLQKVYFRSANLQGTNFDDANLKGANLLRADITNAKMQKAKNLTKKQVLSAMWGVYNKSGECPPSLPDEIKNDPKVQKWLAISEQDKRKKLYSKQGKQKNKKSKKGKISEAVSSRFLLLLIACLHMLGLL